MPTTISIIFSCTSLTVPNAFRSSFTYSISPSDTSSPCTTAVQPSSTSAGVLGMQRTSLIFLPNSSSMDAMVLPAAMLTTTVSSLTASLISAMTSGKNCGFTAKNSTSTADATSVLVEAVSMPYSFLHRSTASGSLSVPSISLDNTSFFFSNPPIIAEAILPSPINPII